LERGRLLLKLVRFARERRRLCKFLFPPNVAWPNTVR